MYCRYTKSMDSNYRTSDQQHHMSSTNNYRPESEFHPVDFPSDFPSVERKKKKPIEIYD